MYALQKALRKRIDEGLDWLTIKTLPVSRDAIPWFWNWADRRYAAWWDSQGLPFVQGPNMLFLNSATPRIDAEECALLDAANCRAMFCHTPWYRDLIAQHRGPANQSPIIMWPYPIDPWPGEPLPDEYDLLIYAKNGHRPMLLEHLAEVFPRHLQIHYGQYQREQLFEAARRSRACAYLADDDHGPLALQEILLAGCPTVGVRTGASFVKSGETGVLVDRLPPGRQCVETDEDERALAGYLEAIEQAQAMDREAVRQLSAEQFDSRRIVEQVIATLATVRESTLSDRSMEIDTICKTLRVHDRHSVDTSGCNRWWRIWGSVYGTVPHWYNQSRLPSSREQEIFIMEVGEQSPEVGTDQHHAFSRSVLPVFLPIKAACCDNLLNRAGPLADAHRVALSDGFSR